MLLKILAALGILLIGALAFVGLATCLLIMWGAQDDNNYPDEYDY